MFITIPIKIFRMHSFTEAWVITSWALLSNMFLMSLFILQHSLLASSIVKDAFATYGFQAIYRSLYVITTSGILLVRDILSEKNVPIFIYIFLSVSNQTLDKNSIGIMGNKF